LGAKAALLRLDPKFKLSKFRAPDPSKPDTFKDDYTKKLMPAGRKAGLPD
jgi:hypothetical protein